MESWLSYHKFVTWKAYPRLSTRNPKTAYAQDPKKSEVGLPGSIVSSRPGSIRRNSARSWERSRHVTQLHQCHPPTWKVDPSQRNFSATQPRIWTPKVHARKVHPNPSKSPQFFSHSFESHPNLQKLIIPEWWHQGISFQRDLYLEPPLVHFQYTLEVHQSTISFTHFFKDRGWSIG